MPLSRGGFESGAHGGGGRDVLSDTANTSGMDARPYVANPGYLAPPVGNRTSYYYTPRDAFRMEAQIRTDFAANYAYRVPGGRGVELFGQVQVINLFNQFQPARAAPRRFGTGSGIAALLRRTVLTNSASGARAAYGFPSPTSR